LVCVCAELASRTYSGTVRQSYGGVGRNIADCLSRLGLVPLFVSRVGHDVAGRAFLDQFRHMVCHVYTQKTFLTFFIHDKFLTFLIVFLL